jgi:hypothetical protein
LDFSTLLLGTAMTVLPLIGAGLVATMVLLERAEPVSPVPANGPAPRRARPRRSRR